MAFEWSWVLIIGGALLVLAEVALGGFAGFDLVLIGSAMLLGGALGLGLHNPAAGFIVAGVLCALYIVVGRRWVRARMTHRSVASNVDAVLGRRGMVTARVSDHEAGQVKVGSETWRALPVSGSGPFDPGVEVTVVAVDGVTLQVR
jgi:membrane protein implicated in regulation of membrane protease activity